MMKETVVVIGGGLAGVEAAWKLAQLGVKTRLYEMKPFRFSPAHKSQDFAELVCSNSFKAMGLGQASGLLQEELKCLDSLIMEAALKNQVAAGQALAVNRHAFSSFITEKINSNQFIEVVREEAEKIPENVHVVIATGPLTSDAMAKSILAFTGNESLYFYDAMAPILEGDSIDRSIAFEASRYGKGEPDYLNCPMTEGEFNRFYGELLSAKLAPTRNFEEERVFQACQPIETLAAKGPKTLLFGPMKPVGLDDPRTGKRPHAVVQLRREDEAGERWNMVGMQTKLAHGEQKRIFRLIPGLENVEFHRLGSLHRNTYVNGPVLLDRYFRLRKSPWIQLAGQITGVEGYLESASAGLWAGLNLGLRVNGVTPDPLPAETAIGSLVNYASSANIKRFEPMNINFGILPALPVRIRDKKQMRLEKSNRAMAQLCAWKNHWLKG